MDRLGEYMLCLAGLMGSQAHVRFNGLTKGSTVIRAKVAHEDLPNVNNRLSVVGSPDAPDDVVRSFREMNGLLRADNARATLKRGRAQIIKFPGCDARAVQRIGPVKEAGQLEGIVISAGGKDSTKHIRIQGHDGEEYKLTTRSVELTKEMGSRLFDLVRVTGMGTWYRNENGQWELENFLVQNCEPLENKSLVEAVAALRELDSGWKKLPDPLATLRELRRN